MSFPQLQDYLSYLMDKDLIKKTVTSNNNGKISKVFVTTKKGNNLLTDINKIQLYFK